MHCDNQVVYYIADNLILIQNILLDIAPTTWKKTDEVRNYILLCDHLSKPSIELWLIMQMR